MGTLAGDRVIESGHARVRAHTSGRQIYTCRIISNKFTPFFSIRSRRFELACHRSRHTDPHRHARARVHTHTHIGRSHLFNLPKPGTFIRMLSASLFFQSSLICTYFGRVHSLIRKLCLRWCAMCMYHLCAASLMRFFSLLSCSPGWARWAGCTYANQSLLRREHRCVFFSVSSFAFYFIAY